MPYLGNQPDSNFTTTTVDTFNGDNSTVAFTLSRSAQTNDLEVFVENVQQQPTTAYSVAGTTITFTSAPPTGTGNIYVIHRGAAITSPTPNADSITTAMLQDGVITQAKIAAGVQLGAGYFLGENGATGDTTNGLGDIFRVHENALDTAVTIAANTNASCTGPITFNATVTVNGTLTVV
jgi:hypothetical protein